MSNDIIGRGDYKILLIESFPCYSKDELTAREGEIIRQYKLYTYQKEHVNSIEKITKKTKKILQR